MALAKDQGVADRPRRLFSAERRLRAEAGVPEAAAPASADMATLLAAIEGLRAEVRSLAGEEEPQAPTAPEQDPEAEDLRSEVWMLKVNLKALFNSIQQTKREIAALRPPGADDDRLHQVSGELDAIVQSTESATNDILMAAESIESLADRIKGQAKDEHIKHVADEIAERVVNIFEACNFQDLTGQRVSKVVKTLGFVEERVETMIEIWGPDAFAELPGDMEPDDVPDDDKKLLNGPALAGEGISQDDIDKLFD